MILLEQALWGLSRILLVSVGLEPVEGLLAAGLAAGLAVGQAASPHLGAPLMFAA